MRVLHVLSSEGTYAKGLGHTLMQSLSTINMDMVRVQDELGDLKENPSSGKTAAVAVTITKIQKQIESLSRLSKIFVRPMSGKGEAQPVNLDGVVDDVIGDMAHLGEAAGIVVRRLGASDLFPSLVTWEIPLRLAISNLITNAVQMVGLLRASGGLVECEIIAEQSASGERVAKVLVSDNGPGIHGYLWSRIFMPMFSTRKDGLGMGLFLAREACRSINASIELETSVLLSGSTFRLCINDVHKRKETR